MTYLSPYQRGHGETIAPISRRASQSQSLAMIRQLETDRILTPHEAGRARKRIGAINATL